MKQVLIGSRFATQKEALSVSFMNINRTLDRINISCSLPDHTDFNQYRYPWSLPYLSKPAFYAARLWEYPFVYYTGEFKKGMKVIDVGCGMNPFTIFLKEHIKCEVVGADPDHFTKGVKYKCHGVSQEFIKKTGLTIVKAGMEKLPFPDNFFDRVLCISVIEHVEREIAQKGIREMARIVKPNGRLIVTLDVNILSELGRPLDLLWYSALLPCGAFDIRWPYHRLGKFCDKLQPADVFGMVLYKDPYKIKTHYQQTPKIFEKNAYEIPKLQQRFAKKLQKLYQKQTHLENSVTHEIIEHDKKTGILRIFKKLFS